MKVLGCTIGLILCLVPALAWAAKADTMDTAWVRRYSGPASGDDIVTGMVVDGRGNTYITGHSPDATAGEDYVTIKYDDAGGTLWGPRYHAMAGSSDWAQAITLDRNYNTIVTGYSGPMPYYNIVTIKYDMAGNPTWTRRYSGIVSTADYGNAVAVDSSGNVYVAGYSVPADTSGDYWITLKYDPAGHLVWAVNHRGMPGGDSKATAIAVDNRGNVFVGGYIWNQGNYEDFCTICYDASGNQKWLATWNGPGNAPDFLQRVAATGNGGVCVNGITKTNAGQTGVFIWGTVRYDSSGKQMWSQTYGSSISLPNGIVVDKGGNVIVAGSISNASSWATVKYDSTTSGGQKWAVTYQGSGASNEANGVAVDRNGSIYVTGLSKDTNAASPNMMTICYDDGGHVRWQAAYHDPAGGESYGALIGLDGSLNAYVSGEVFDTATKCFDILTMRYGDVVAAKEKPGSARVNALSLAVSPNPSRGGGEVSYALPQSGKVALELYDVTGAAVAALYQGYASAGRHTVSFSLPQSPLHVFNGVYLLRLNAGGQSITQKLVVRE